jgi:hypothetical protein
MWRNLWFCVCVVLLPATSFAQQAPEARQSVDVGRIARSLALQASQLPPPAMPNLDYAALNRAAQNPEDPEVPRYRMHQESLERPKQRIFEGGIRTGTSSPMLR